MRRVLTVWRWGKRSARFMLLSYISKPLFSKLGIFRHLVDEALCLEATDRYSKRGFATAVTLA